MKFFKLYPRDFVLFFAGIILISLGESIFNSVLNNYLHEAFNISSLQRTLLELPRELPGFLVAFIAALLFFIRSRRQAVLAAILCSIGMLLTAFTHPTFSVFLIWIFVFSTGQHLLLPLTSSIAMELAHEGKDGKRLGQVNSVRNLAIVIGSFAIFMGFRFLHFNFSIAFFLGALMYLGAAFVYRMMHPGPNHSAKLRLQLRKPYALYYILSILFGSRKQIFLTFAPWVLVSIYHKPTSVIASLMTIGGVLGIFIQPILGKAIDHLGEKTILISEAIILFFVCLCYGYAGKWFSVDIAFLVSSACYILDQMLMSVNMARATYMKKIALHKDHVTPALTMSVTMDHIFSISIAILGGIIWFKLGYQVVFLFGSGIALLNFIAALFIKIPKQSRQ